MNNEETKQALSILATSWPNRPLSAAAHAMWGQKLSAYPARDVMRVIEDLVCTKEWRPSLAEILSLLEPKVDELTADEAFALTWEQASKRPRVVPPLVRETIRLLGGWDVIGMWSTDRIDHHRKRFGEVYAGVLQRDRAARLAGPSRPENIALDPAEDPKPRLPAGRHD